jgi:hypothetical protein
VQINNGKWEMRKQGSMFLWHFLSGPVDQKFLPDSLYSVSVVSFQ